MARDGTKNLIPLNQRTKEEQKEIVVKGGIASGEARREKATMKKMLEMCLEMKNQKGQTYRELATLGLIKGAMKGNAYNYETIMKTLGEYEAMQESKALQEMNKVEELLTKIKEEALDDTK